MENHPYTIIDTDTHLTEPSDVWTSRIPAKYHNRIPRVERTDEGIDTWFIGDDRLTTACSSAMAGWPKFWPDCPPRYEDALPAAYDSKERIKYMDTVGIWSMVLYPNVAGFGAERFLRMGDKGLMLDCVRAYNDFLTDWISPDPRRFVAVSSMPFWDVEASVAEIERCKKMGHKGILFTCAPQVHGMPYLSDPYWAPFFEAAQDSGLPISFHIGTGVMDGGPRPNENVGSGIAYARGCVSAFLNNGAQLTDLLLSGVLPRYPDLKFVSVESGIGWLPFVLEAVDHQFKVAGCFDQAPEFEELPSAYFNRQVYGNFWFEEVAPRVMLDVLPIDHIMFETDFPHATCLYQGAVQERVDACMAHVSDEVRHKVLWQNAVNLYGIEEPS